MFIISRPQMQENVVIYRKNKSDRIFPKLFPNFPFTLDTGNLSTYIFCLPVFSAGIKFYVGNRRKMDAKSY